MYILCIYILFFRLSYIIQTYDEMVWLKNYLFLQYHLIDNKLHVECVEKKPQRKIQETVIFFMQNLFTDNIFFKPVFYTKKVIFCFIKVKYNKTIFYQFRQYIYPHFFHFVLATYIPVT